MKTARRRPGKMGWTLIAIVMLALAGACLAMAAVPTAPAGSYYVGGFVF